MELSPPSAIGNLDQGTAQPAIESSAAGLDAVVTEIGNGEARATQLILGSSSAATDIGHGDDGRTQTVIEHLVAKSEAIATDIDGQGKHGITQPAAESEAIATDIGNREAGATQPGLTATELQAIMIDLGIGDAEVRVHTTTAQSAAEFLGFDPQKIIAAFLEKANSHQPHAEDTMVEYAGIRFYECKCEPKTDLLLFLVLYLLRGSNIKKICMNCEPRFACLLKRKAAIYNLKEYTRIRSKAQVRLDSSSLTLSRLSLSFAPGTIAIIIGHKIEGKLRPRLFPGTKLPILMQHAVFSTSIPQEHKLTVDLRRIAQILHVESKLLLAKFSEKIRIQFQSLEKMLEDAEKYVDATMNISPFPDEVRVRILIKSEIITESGSFTSLGLIVKNLTDVVFSQAEAKYIDVVAYMKEHQRNHPSELH